MTTLTLRRLCDQYPDVGWLRTDTHWVVVVGETVVGSISQQPGGFGRGSWQWSLTWPMGPQPAENAGVAPGLAEAQAAFRARWDAWEASGFGGPPGAEKGPPAGASGGA